MVRIHVGGDAADFPVERVYPVAELEFVACRLHVQRAAARSELSRGHLHQAHELLTRVLRWRLDTEAHVEDVDAGGIGRRTAAAEAEQQRGFEPRCRILVGGAPCFSRVEPNDRDVRRNAPPAETVVRRRGGDAGHAGAVVAQNAETERFGWGSAGAGHAQVAEVERPAAGGVGGQVGMAGLEPRIDDRKLDTGAVLVGAHSAGHA